MIYSPIWKDIVFNTENIPFDYIIKKDGVVLHTGYASSYPGGGMVSINVNQLVEEYLSPEFDGDISEVDDEVVTNPKAYGVFNITDEGGNEYETYGFLGDWSYVDGWSGQTRHLMSQPINGHLDPRMKLMCSYFNSGQTSIEYAIGNYFSVQPTSISFSSVEARTGATRTVSVYTDGDWTVNISGWSGFSVANITLNSFDVVLRSGATVDEYSATVTVSNGSNVQTVSVSLGANLQVIPYSSSKNYTGAGVGYDVIIKSDVGWHQWTPEDGGDASVYNRFGLVLTPSSGGTGETSVRITAPINTGTTSGDVSCTIVVWNGSSYVKHTNPFLIKYVPYYHISIPSVTLTSAQTSRNVAVSSNASISGVTSDQTWLTAATANASSFNITASTNTKAVSRDANVVVYLSGTSVTGKTIVTQEGKDVGGTNILEYSAGSRVEPNNTSAYYWGANYLPDESAYYIGNGRLVFDDSITGIAGGAFSGNTNLTLVKIPSSVTAVYTSAFTNCSSLMTIYVYSSGISNPASNAFTGLPNGGTLHLPSGIPSSTYTRWVQIFGAKNWTIVQDL